MLTKRYNRSRFPRRPSIKGAEQYNNKHGHNAQGATRMGRSEMETPRGSSAAEFDIATFSPIAESDVVGRHGIVTSREVPVSNPDIQDIRKAVDEMDALANQEAKEAGRQRADELLVERFGAVSVIDALHAKETYEALQADEAKSSETEPGTGQYL